MMGLFHALQKGEELLSKVNTAGILGIEGYLVKTEVDIGNGLPSFNMVGYLSSEVREAKDRVQTALKNSGFMLYARKITVNLSPAGVRKDGTAYDLPIAVAILAAFGAVRQDLLGQVLIAGELGLDGSVKKIRGVLSMASTARKEGLTMCFVPAENVREAKCAGDITVIGVSALKELIDLLNHPENIKEENETYTEEQETSYAVDFSEVNGQEVMRRATEIAVSGMHNILYIGPAGSGKSMVAKRIPTIMPPLSREESIEVTKVYSVCGLLPEDGSLLRQRPFRSPHHSLTAKAMSGGGRIPKPGEISLASRGVLFLDELPEFSSDVLELLRQPMEDRQIVISRLRESCVFPADTMIAAAMNPCPCGFFPDRRRCRCTPEKIRKYLARVSGPFLDRMDICAEAAPVSYEMVSQDKQGESSSRIRARVERTRATQQERFRGMDIYFNSEMGKKELKQFCRLGKEEEDFLKEQFTYGRLSARGCDKVLKVARTIADMEEKERIALSHLCEAAAYRGIEEKYWGGGNDE